MNSIDMPSRVCVSFSSFRICACTVTSSAVVGSSAISKSGSLAKRHGDHDALALAAGELMRIACEPGLRIGNADLGEQFEDAPARGLPGKSLVKQQDFGDLLLDGVQRIERRHRLLEDDGDVVAAHVADFVFRHGEQFAAP